MQVIVSTPVTGQCEYCSAEWSIDAEGTRTVKCSHVQFEKLRHGPWKVTFHPMGPAHTSLSLDLRNRLFLKKVGIKVW